VILITWRDKQKTSNSQESDDATAASTISCAFLLKRNYQADYIEAGDNCPGRIHLLRLSIRLIFSDTLRGEESMHKKIHTAVNKADGESHPNTKSPCQFEDLSEDSTHLFSTP